MRDATKIKQLANEALQLVERIEVIAVPGVRTALNNTLDEIAIIAERMDARTGTTDPSKKKWWRFGL